MSILSGPLRPALPSSTTSSSPYPPTPPPQTISSAQDTARVKAVVENKLMMAWLRVSQSSKIKFLKYLDVEEEPKLMEQVLRAIFRFSQSDEEVEELIQVCAGSRDGCDAERALYNVRVCNVEEWLLSTDHYWLELIQVCIC